MWGSGRSLPVSAFGKLVRSGVTVSFSAAPRRESVDNEVERLNRVVVASPARPESAQYDVALSFAAEDQEYVHRVADALAAKGVTVLYDSFEEADQWGKDFYSHLAEIYGSRACFTAIFVSAAYGAKVWTNPEREAAQARAFTQNSEYILPVRIDDTEIPGILPTTSYVRASTKRPEELASLLVVELARADRWPERANYVPSRIAACKAKGEYGNESGISVDAVDRRATPTSCDRNSAGGVAEPEHTVVPLRHRHAVRIGWATLVGLAIGGLVALYAPLGSPPEGAGIPSGSRRPNGSAPTGQTTKDPRQVAPEPTVSVRQTASMLTPPTAQMNALSPRAAKESTAEPERIASPKQPVVSAPGNVSARVSKGNQRADKRTSSSVGKTWADSLRVELARCGQAGFIEQIICREKARWKYCNPGRWGAVRECAGAKSHTDSLTFRIRHPQAV